MVEVDGLLADSPVQTLRGQSTSLSTLADGKATAIFFLRDAACVLAQAYIQELRKQAEAFAQANIRVLVFVNSTVDGASSVLSPEQLPFEVICDGYGDVYARYGVGTAASKEALGNEDTLKRIQKAYEDGFLHGTDTGDPLRLPALFVFDAQRRARFVHYGIFGDDLPEVASLPEKLRGIVSCSDFPV